MVHIAQIIRIFPLLFQEIYKLPLVIVTDLDEFAEECRI